MARPRKTDTPDTAQAIELTAGAIERLSCRTDTKAQAFLRDTKAPGLRVRVSNTGHKAYVFETKLDRRTVRRTIGDVRAWTLEQARTEARRLAVLIDAGTDPAELERQQRAEREAQRQQDQAQAVTVGEAWAIYTADRRQHWGERNYDDHIKAAHAGGEPFKRGEGTTKPGPLASLLGLPLAQIDTATIEAWAAREARTRPTQARLSMRMLRAFFNWCATHADYRHALSGNPAKTTRAREVLGKAKPKQDALLREQLPAWFAAVRIIRNPVISAYLQALLLTGARPGELLALRWDDINAQWRGLTIRDKDASKGGREGTRVIPLTPYVHHLLAGLPRRSEWVFSSDRTGAAVATPNKVHASACEVAGIEYLTLHGLRRSFGSLSEWQELPTGVVAQIMGHKPSATAERHYRVRPLDLLRVHHEKLERWILEQAGIVFDAQAVPGKLRLAK